MPKDLKLTEKESINVMSPIYFERLKEVLEMTSKRTIINYMIWRSLLLSSTFLNNEVRMRKNKFLISQRSQNEMLDTYSPLWKECVSYTASTLTISISALYIRRYFNEDSRHRVVEMVDDVKATYIEMIKDNSWMDEITKKNALEKARALATHIAYPDELMDDGKVEEYYAGLDLRSDEHFMNALKINQFKIDHAFQQLRKPNNKTDWTKHASSAVINAFYSLYENSIRKIIRSFNLKQFFSKIPFCPQNSRRESSKGSSFHPIVRSI